MNIEDELRIALREETKKWVAPPELKEQILKNAASTQGGRRMKKWLVVGIVAAALLIPTGAYAGYNYLADSMYGSQENIAPFGGTQESYDRLEAKLQNARQSFSDEEFTKLMFLLKKLGSYNLKIADSKGKLHPEQLSVSEQALYKKLTAELEPYFEHLNKEGAPEQAVKTLDANAFWKEQIAIAGKTFSEEELADFQRILEDLKIYNAKVFDPNGSVYTDRLSETDKANQKKLYEQLKPYTDKLGILVKAP
jgi:hypothetical protein